MLNRRRTTQVSLVAAAGVSAFLLGSAATFYKFGSLPEQWFSFGSRSTEQTLTIEPINPDPGSVVFQLAAFPVGQRSAQLEALANDPTSPDQSRARYLLANDLLKQNQAKRAIALLEGLEEKYPALAAHIVFKRAKAYEQAGNQAKARETWQDLLNRYPTHPVAAEALFVLGRKEAKYWDQAIAQFPAHPRSSDIARQRLQQNPNQPQLLLLLAKHAFYSPGITSVLDRLATRHILQLKAEDWEAIAFAYWENVEYGKAGLAYIQAPRTPKNLYRAARGLHLSGRNLQAVNLYQQLVREFPNAPETATGLLRLAKLVEKPMDGIAYLDQVIARFPDQAAEAWVAKANMLDKLNSAKSAAQARQLVLLKYSKSDAAAELRWSQAQKRADMGDVVSAWKWAKELTEQNPDSPLAPEAAFWVGKWASRLGRGQDAKSAFEYVLAHYPESYYAWRAAGLLNLKVGDFTTVRYVTPQAIRLPQRFKLDAGSPALNELYLLGQDLDAWTLWQTEFQNPKEPTVAEQFTDGLMRLGVGDNLDGIYMISSLDQRESAEERSQFAALKRHPAYWQALYPLPFIDPIRTWSQERQLNPLLVIALIRQESRFEPGIRSSAGATGLMQVMPDTGAWVAEKIKLKQYKLDNPNDSIKLGTWYLDYTHREYNENSMLAVASYNAGPGNVADWLAKKGLADPDEFVEAIPFDETRGYVKSVFENYWNYMRLYDPETAGLLSRYTRNSGS